MPASDSQNSANRQNAQSSTGPRTEEGKAVSSRNATKDGFCARYAVLKTDRDRDDFNTLHTKLFNDLLPQEGIEEILFEQMLIAAWNMRRCNARIAQLAFEDRDPIDCHIDQTTTATGVLRNLETYFRRNERTFTRNLKTLRDIQTERIHRERAGAVDTTKDVSILVRTQPLRRAQLQEDLTKTQIESTSIRTAMKVPEITASRYSRQHSMQLLTRL